MVRKLCTLESVIYSDGSSSVTDDVVGSEIIGNTKHPFAKLVDLDVDCQYWSTIYGLNFGIRSKGSNAFYGKWTRSVIAQNMWRRIKCYSKENFGKELYQDSFPIGAQSTTTITNIEWGEYKKSRALKELMAASGGGNLTVRVSLSYYTRNYPSYVRKNATLGYVVGVIGAPSPDDTLNFPGYRVMAPTQNMPQVTFKDTDLCHGQELGNFGSWMNTAPFEVSEDMHEVRLDLSNSVPTNLYNTIRSFGTLRLGSLRSSAECVQLFGNEDGIPYNVTKEELEVDSGIYTITVDPWGIAKDPLVIVQMLVEENDEDNTHTKICGETLFVKSVSHKARILLLEPTYYVRPKDYYVDRLERNHNPRSHQTLFITKYGRPAAGVSVKVSPMVLEKADATIPSNGIIPNVDSATTDDEGFVHFEFSVNPAVEIPKERKYEHPVTCSGSKKSILPIDGQVYYFKYVVDEKYSNKPFAFLVFSDVRYIVPYDWVHDVGPILSQYARLSQVMTSILDLSSYTDVIKPRNIDLIKLSFNADFEDPSYMPTTRDLSKTKAKMILEWLNQLPKPVYDKTNKDSKPPSKNSKCKPQSLGTVETMQ